MFFNKVSECIREVTAVFSKTEKGSRRHIIQMETET